MDIATITDPATQTFVMDLVSHCGREVKQCVVSTRGVGLVVALELGNTATGRPGVQVGLMFEGGQVTAQVKTVAGRSSPVKHAPLIERTIILIHSAF